jgi:hypothetical protein
MYVCFSTAISNNMNLLPKYTKFNINFKTGKLPSRLNWFKNFVHQKKKCLTINQSHTMLSGGVMPPEMVSGGVMPPDMVSGEVMPPDTVSGGVMTPDMVSGGVMPPDMVSGGVTGYTRPFIVWHGLWLIYLF